MSANLAQTKDGKTMFVSLRENPWHNQGTVIEDEVPGLEMLKLAHMDWEVCEGPAFTNIKRRVATGWNALGDQPIYTITDEVKPIPGKKAIYRQDTGDVLGVVGSEYVSFGNSQMIDFFEGLVQGKKIRYETAGALGNGETVWVMASIPDLAMAIKGDEILSYMLIKTGHIGNLNLACHPTNVRVVCSNTMRAASEAFASRRTLHGKQNVNSGYKIRHTSGMLNAVKDVQVAYQNLVKDFTATKALYEMLAGREVDSKEVREYFQKTVATKSEEAKAKEISKAAATRQSNKIDDLMKLWEAPTNQTGTRNTAFSLYNTVVEWIDFEKSTRCVGEDKNESVCRFESAMFGNGADQKDNALVEALALV